MKELNTEEKAKAYDEAVINGSRLWECGEITRENYEYIFPELKESEDERIRKEIISALKFANVKGVYDKHIAWLEKQDTDISSFPKEQQVFMRKYVSFDKITLIKLLAERDANNAEIIESFEKQDEQNQNHFELKAGHWYIYHRAFCCRADHLTVKEGERFMCEKDDIVKGFVIKEPEKYFKEVCAPAPIEDDQELTDKVEPKFKVGDWIVSNMSHEDYCICKILKIRNGEYVIKSIYGYQGYNNFETFDKDYHLWTIQDAKDGDVLCYKDEISLYKHDIKNCTKQETTFGGFVYHCCYDGKRFIMDSLYSLTEQDKIDIHPATKEQRDILFQKMKETGYEWDTETKELKIEEVDNLHNYLYGEQNPAWSEDDENTIKVIKRIIKKSEIIDPLIYTDLLKEKLYDWLKSLKDRVQPQSKQEWSEEDNINLEKALWYVENPAPMVAKDSMLVEWLKSLKVRVQPQSTWKPSDVAIGHICDGNYNVDLDILDSIYRDFKKLREK